MPEDQAQMPLPQERIVQLHGQLLPGDFLVDDYLGDRILVIRSRRQFPDIVNDVEAVIEKLDNDETDSYTHTVIIGEEEAQGIDVELIKKRMVKRKEDDEAIVADLRTRLAEKDDPIIFESEADPQKLVRFGVGIDRSLTEFVGDNRRDILEGMDIQDVGDVNYIVADDGFLRLDKEEMQDILGIPGEDQKVLELESRLDDFVSGVSSMGTESVLDRLGSDGAEPLSETSPVEEPEEIQLTDDEVGVMSNVPDVVPPEDTAGDTPSEKTPSTTTMAKNDASSRNGLMPRPKSLGTIALEAARKVGAISDCSSQSREGMKQPSDMATDECMENENAYVEATAERQPQEKVLAQTDQETVPGIETETMAQVVPETLTEVSPASPDPDEPEVEMVPDTPDTIEPVAEMSPGILDTNETVEVLEPEQVEVLEPTSPAVDAREPPLVQPEARGDGTLEDAMTAAGFVPNRDGPTDADAMFTDPQNGNRPVLVFSPAGECSLRDMIEIEREVLRIHGAFGLVVTDRLDQENQIFSVGKPLAFVSAEEFRTLGPRLRDLLK